MLCRHPYFKEGFPYPCGQCMPCRINKKRHWTHRIVLEAGLYSSNSFVTLTYDDTNMPRLEDGRGTLRPKDAQDFLKRLRARIAPTKLRFFCVGEYGKTTERPHYHLAIFNYPNCFRLGGSIFKERNGKLTCCPACDLIYDCWGQGFVNVKRIGVESAEYIAGYTTKKMTKFDDYRLKGRHPEFARMSLKPGIGADAMHEVASTILQYNLETNEEMIDVPSELRHGSKKWPLAPYLRKKLRVLIGRDERTPDEVLEALLEELRPVQEAAQDMASLHFPNDVKAYGRIYKQMILEKNAGRADRVEYLSNKRRKDKL